MDVQSKISKPRSTTLGSIAMSSVYKQQPTPAYKISKAALNMLTVQYALDLGDAGFTILAVCPGVSEALLPNRRMQSAPLQRPAACY